MLEKIKRVFRKEDTLYWFLMNVGIVVAVPFVIRLLCIVLETPITPNFASITSDFALASFSALFNIGVYMVSEISTEESVWGPSKEIQNRLVEDLIDNIISESRENYPHKLLKELKNKLQEIFADYLNESTVQKRKKTLEWQRNKENHDHAARINEDNIIKHRTIYVFLFLALCAFLYGIEISKDLNIRNLVVHTVIIAILIIACSRWGLKTLETVRVRKNRERN